MDHRSTDFPGVLLIEPQVCADARGIFYETLNARSFAALTGIDTLFAQDNQSKSARSVLRSLHYQVAQAQGKLVGVVAGEVFNVCVGYPPELAHFRALDRIQAASGK